ncbi:MAG: PASTA domain-containing protein [Candidatus Margulisiibacteriota bacterium]
MLISYISFYLIFIISISILIGLLVLRLNLPKPRMVISIIVAIIISPLIIGYLYITYFTSIPEAVVPDMRGLPLEKAFEKLESLKLEGTFAGTVFDMKYPEGSVVNQRPEGGRMVKIGRVVRLVTSSGKRRVMVPNLLGRLAVQAEAVLAAKGLQLGKVEQDFVPELDSGIILTQNPLPGEEAKVGSYVNITVSATEEPEIILEATEEAEGAEEGGFKFWW